MDTIPPEVLLADYPDAVRAIAERLRRIVKDVVPDAVERVRPGWRLIGYDVPRGKRLRYFAFIWAEPIHAHIGFEYGAWMLDPERRLEGAHLKLRKVRYVTIEPGDEIHEDALAELVREGMKVALLTPAERMGRVLDGSWTPGATARQTRTASSRENRG